MAGRAVSSVLLRALGATAVVALAACGPSGETASSATAASTPSAPSPHRQPPRSGKGAARIEASSLPVPEDYERELRKQITSSNYLDALESAAAEASAAKRVHP